MTFTPFSASPSLAPQASTGLPGFVLANGTSTFLTWNVPNDGKVHRVMPFGEVVVTSAETGGQITLSYTDPGGTPRTNVSDGGGHAAGVFPLNNFSFTVAPGTTVTLAQTSALTLGAATVWAELVGS